MKNNDTTASNGNNLIVGTNTSIGTISNTFVRNDPSTAFSPTASNTFYVNTQGGMGVNTNAPVVKFDSRGAVKFGTLSPNQDICSSNP
jgi:hypothetical protein